MDPAQRIALMCATEALEEAGIVPGRTPSTQHNRVGVYFGVTSNDWMETNSAQNVDSKHVHAHSDTRPQADRVPQLQHILYLVATEHSYQVSTEISAIFK